MSVKIRWAQPADAEAIVPLIAGYWSDDGIDGFDAARLRKQAEEFLAQTALGQAWLADVGGMIGGYLICTFVYSLRLQDRGCHALQMQVTDGNIEAQRFYRHLGFTEKSGYRVWIKALAP